MKKSKIFLAAFLLIAAVSPLVRAQDPAAQQPAANPSDYFEVKDTQRGFALKTPNINWNVNIGTYAISLSHGTYYDAYISLKKGWYTVTTADEAYSSHLDSLKRYMPGAEFLKEKEAVTVGTEAGFSVTYKDPSQKKVYREIVFIHKGVPYELSFSVKEENFDKVKEDFGAILRGLQTM